MSILMAGCSGDTTAPPPNRPNDNSGLAQGTINPAVGGFEVKFRAPCGVDETGVVWFFIRGTNVRYDDGIGALLVDITVTNHTRCAFHEPVWLTFVDLLPEGVTVLNPDNGENGPGAAILCEFENDDAMWTPLEESIPRTIQFGVDPGVSIGFAARVDVGADSTTGSIGGIVWHDADKDGVIDPGEPGIGGVLITMESTDGPEVLWRTLTEADGSYRFDNLHSGHYAVTHNPQYGCEPTTPTTINVILVEQNGTVGDFMDANFGCARQTRPPTIEVGDDVEVSGQYQSRPHHIVAKVIDVYKCGWPLDDRDRGDEGDIPCIAIPSELMGPVNAVNLDRRALQVMGAWVVFDSIPDDTTISWGVTDPRTIGDLDLKDVEPGDRVRVRVSRVSTNLRFFVGIGLWTWPAEDDRVHGAVEEVIWMPPGPPSGITVLGTYVVITGETVINIKRR